MAQLLPVAHILPQFFLRGTSSKDAEKVKNTEIVREPCSSPAKCTYWQAMLERSEIGKPWLTMLVVPSPIVAEDAIKYCDFELLY